MFRWPEHMRRTVSIAAQIDVQILSLPLLLPGFLMETKLSPAPNFEGYYGKI